MKHPALNQIVISNLHKCPLCGKTRHVRKGEFVQHYGKGDAVCPASGKTRAQAARLSVAARKAAA